MNGLNPTFDKHPTKKCDFCSRVLQGLFQQGNYQELLQTKLHEDDS